MWDLDGNAEACAETKANAEMMWFRTHLVDLQREPHSGRFRSPNAIKESTLNRMQSIGFTEGQGHGTSEDTD